MNAADREPLPLAPEDFASLRRASEVALAPDGLRLAFAFSQADLEADVQRSRIALVDARSGLEDGAVSPGDGDQRAPRFSPDGALLAFLWKRGEGPPQLHAVSTRGGEPVPLTALPLGAGPAVFSPDGTRIVFAAPLSEESEGGRDGRSKPRVVRRAHHKSDGDASPLAGSSLYLVPADGTAPPIPLTRGPRDRAPAWSPDGRRIAFSRKRGGTLDLSAEDLWVLDVSSGEERRLTEDLPCATSPAWSPRGDAIACTASDDLLPGLEDPMARVFIVPLAPGERPRAISPDLDRGVAQGRVPGSAGPVWSSDGATVAFAIGDRGAIHLVRAHLDGRTETVVGGARQVTSFSLAPSGALAFVATGPLEPGDVYVRPGDGTPERRLTRLNASIEERLAAALRCERRSFRTATGEARDGWLLTPARGARGARLLVCVHGGPHAFVGDAFAEGHIYRYVLASRGWAVLALNAVGSGSYGKAFVDALRGRWGEADLPEHLAAVDALAEEGTVDRARVAIGGCSYGGYLAAYAIGHTNRFRAAIAGAPIANLESFYGTSDVGPWFTEWGMRGGPLERAELYRRLSPITRAHEAATPVLLLHGEEDARCPIGQSEELYARLVKAGRAQVELVRYPGASHQFLSSGAPSHRQDFARRFVEWVERHT